MQPQYYGAAAQYNKNSKKPLSSRIFLYTGIVFVVIILITVLAFVFTSLTSGPRNQAASLQLRQTNLRDFVINNQRGIKNADLAKTNSDLSILLSSDVNALQKQLSLTYGNFDFPPEVVAAENDSTSTKKLKDAELINKFDIIYKQILEAKIASSLQLAQQVAGNERGAYKTAIQNAIKSLTTITKELEKITI